MDVISVITATHDRPDSLLRACESVRRQDYPSVEHVVVADGPQPGDCHGVCEEQGAKYIELTRHYGDWGATPRLIGTAAARGGLIAYLDDDCLFLPGHLSKLAAVLADARLDLAHSLGWVVPDGGLVWGDLAAGHIDTNAMMHRRGLLDRATWRASGYGNDTDLVRRSRDAGATATLLREITFHWTKHPDRPRV